MSHNLTPANEDICTVCDSEFGSDAHEYHCREGKYGDRINTTQKTADMHGSTRFQIGNRYMIRWIIGHESYLQSGITLVHIDRSHYVNGTPSFVFELYHFTNTDTREGFIVPRSAITASKRIE